MTSTPTGQVIPTAIGRDLVLERVLPGSIDDAWASITESDRLGRWFCTWTGEPRVGATLELTLVAEEGDAKSQAEIRECEPPTHLAVSTHDQGGTWLLEATLTPIDSNQRVCASCIISTKRPSPRRSALAGSTTLTGSSPP
jgi:uncharacterized protein YndB with AHSA1/START domain